MCLPEWVRWWAFEQTEQGRDHRRLHNDLFLKATLSAPSVNAKQTVGKQAIGVLRSHFVEAFHRRHLHGSVHRAGELLLRLWARFD